MESKIETARHNLKIQMDKELVVLQKQINLHVHDIERYQGFVSRLSAKKGNTVEELRRNKEKARNTMKQLKSQKVSNKSAGAGQSTQAAGRDSIVQSNYQSQKTVSQTNAEAFQDGSPVDILLFGFKKTQGSFMTSFNASQSSDGPSGNAHVVQALRHILRNQPILEYSVSTVGADGRRLYSEENTLAAGGLGKLT